jgi:ElaB/YqjD/DUF883 family membrane-anchored ribosome-binding protein
MSQSSKDFTPQIQGSRPPAPAEIYKAEGPAIEYIGDINDDVRVRVVAPHTRHEDIAERIGEQFDRASVAVQRVARETRQKAERGARSTAETIREHPVATVAIIGGIATVALAGARLLRTSHQDTPQPLAQKLPSAPKKVVRAKSARKKA